MSLQPRPLTRWSWHPEGGSKASSPGRFFGEFVSFLFNPIFVESFFNPLNEHKKLEFRGLSEALSKTKPDWPGRFRTRMNQNGITG